MAFQSRPDPADEFFCVPDPGPERKVLSLLRYTAGTEQKQAHHQQDDWFGVSFNSFISQTVIRLIALLNYASYNN